MDFQKIAYLGIKGSYTEFAARSLHRGDFHGYGSIHDVFRAVSSGETQYGVIPIENSLEGSLGITSDLLYREDVQIASEYNMRIEHCLVAKPGRDPASVTTVISHPQALGQCASYISRKGLIPVPFPDTASAIAALSEDRYSDCVAIGSESAARIYGMENLEKGIGDYQDNYTRFISITRPVPGARGSAGMKSSVVVSLEATPGSLMKALEIYYRKGVNLTRVESRPVKFSPWRYIFFLDAEFRDGDEEVLDELKNSCSSFKLLGIYPKGKL